MFISRQSTVGAMAAVALVVLSSCGGSEASVSSEPGTPTLDSVAVTESPVETEVPVTEVDGGVDGGVELPTYTIVSGDTLSGIAVRAGVTLDALVAANAWSDGIDHLITPGDVIDLPAGASLVTPPESTAPSESTVDAAGAEYGAPTFDLEYNDGRTAPIVTPLADGIYYAFDSSVDGSTITLQLGQWFSCDGDGVPDAPSVECASGVGTLTEPTATVTVSADARVTINTGDLSTFTKADVSVAEFARLIDGQAPAAGAPDGYEFFDYPLFIRVEDGVAVEVEQIYTS